MGRAFRKPRRVDPRPMEFRPFWSHPLYLVLAFIMAQAIFFFSPYFRVRELVIEGCQRTSPHQIRELTHFRAGHHILAMRFTSARQRIRDLLWVKEVTFSRRWPHAIEIKIQERIPSVRVEGTQIGQWFLADDGGRVLMPAGDTGEFFPRLRVDKPIEAGSEVGGRVQILLRCWPYLGESLARQVRYATIDAANEITLYAGLQEPGIFIYLGKDTQMKEKMRVLGLIVERLEEEKEPVMYIDLRIPDRPAVMPRQPKTTPAGRTI